MSAMFYSTGPIYSSPTFPKEEPPKRLQGAPGGLIMKAGPFYEAQEKMALRADETRCGTFCIKCKDFIDYMELNGDESPLTCFWCESMIS